MRNKKSSGSISGKGYYIALGLCAVAIGISGFLYYRNAGKTPPAPSGNEETLGNHQAVIATNPDGSVIPDSGEKPQPRLQTASPLQGQTVAVYAMDSLIYNQTTRDWRVHNGVDLAAEAGTEVMAAADGVVYTTYTDDMMGTTVVIRHENGYTTRYASLAEELKVGPGDQVVLGQVIGTVGETALVETAAGPHVHFSVLCNDETVDPADFLALGNE